MRLAPQLIFAFGLLTAVSTGGLGFALRQELRREESTRFLQDVQSACESVKDEVSRQALADNKLLSLACQADDGLADRALTSSKNGDIDWPVRMGTLVPDTRKAFDLDELTLATPAGEVLFSDPLDRRPPAEVAALIRGTMGRWDLRTVKPEAVVSRCKRDRGGGLVAGLIGARHLVKLLDRLRTPLKVSTIRIGAPAVPPPAFSEQASCTIADGSGAGVPIVVTKEKVELYDAWQAIDRTVLFATAVLTGAALLLAVIVARRLGRPLAELARQAAKVATEEAKPLQVRGSGEIGELVTAFDRMLEDLAATRRRLAATSRVAAWREVARRVAHEVKNPLAPIRAAVETLRRLRARGDPAFDEYFDEATRTVLDEVHRISNIVTEFTRFARLPPPRPQDVDLVEVVRHVIQLQKANAGDARLDHLARGNAPKVRADRDQIVQVLMNLVQNALEAVKDAKEGMVVVTIQARAGGYVDVSVADNGPGVASEIAGRLFEPYATTKERGTGLGLAIAQRIAIEHNGELSYVTPPGANGATFRLTLPVEGPPPLSDAPTSSDPNGEERAGTPPAP
jgi:two-component system nitrogen regulation sensor histidine kinase NtrY